jgi:hypothetical protein
VRFADRMIGAIEDLVEEPDDLFRTEAQQGGVAQTVRAPAAVVERLASAASCRRRFAATTSRSQPVAPSSRRNASFSSCANDLRRLRRGRLAASQTS